MLCLPMYVYEASHRTDFEQSSGAKKIQKKIKLSEEKSQQDFFSYLCQSNKKIGSAPC